jgi:hypothetical protein
VILKLNLEVKPGEGVAPAGLPGSQDLSCHEIFEGSVVRDYLDRVGCSLEFRSPLVKGAGNSQQLIIVDQIVELSLFYSLREECYWVLLLIILELGKYYSYNFVRDISL